MTANTSTATPHATNAGQDAAASGEPAVKSETVIALRNLRGKPWRRAGVTHEGQLAEGHHADIIPGKSIRLFGIETNRYGGPKAYDKTFKVGDEAEYGSYNLHYFGKILAIGAKTVRIETSSTGGRSRLLDPYEFSFRNRDDADRKHEANADWRD